mmetsp:Transcript_7061/g.15061  ORF Transcript_7061/g.15061 Transcript_7061/m.15061 type:complete len:81 (-) Transcript_7061:1710-1952(-)
MVVWTRWKIENGHDDGWMDGDLLCCYYRLGVRACIVYVSRLFLNSMDRPKNSSLLKRHGMYTMNQTENESDSIVTVQAQQ